MGQFSQEWAAQHPGGSPLWDRMRKVASEDARNLFLTAYGDGARFRPAAKWFTHRTSLTQFAGPTAGRRWGRSAAMAGVTRDSSPPTNFPAAVGSGLFAKTE